MYSKEAEEFEMPNYLFNWRWINCKSGKYRVVTIEEMSEKFFNKSEATSVASDIKVQPYQFKWAPDTGDDCSKYFFRWRDIERDGKRFKCITLEK